MFEKPTRHLLPKNYQKRDEENDSNEHDSGHKGSGGLLPIAISLVAFSCQNRENLHHVLVEDKVWRDGKWHRHNRITGRKYITTRKTGFVQSINT